MSPIPLPHIAIEQILPRAAILFGRDDNGSKSGLSAAAIAGIVLLVLAVVFSAALILLYVVRQRRKADANRDSFIPNNFKIVGHFSSILDSRRSSRAPSVYKPTNEYGQYRAPPLPQQAHHHARSVSHSNMLRKDSLV